MPPRTRCARLPPSASAHDLCPPCSSPRRYACVKKLGGLRLGGGVAGRSEADEVAVVEHALARNFGGKPKELERVLAAFHAQRLAETDPHGLTQGMARVEVRLRRLAQAEVQQLDAVLRDGLPGLGG